MRHLHACMHADERKLSARDRNSVDCFVTRLLLMILAGFSTRINVYTRVVVVRMSKFNLDVYQHLCTMNDGLYHGCRSIVVIPFALLAPIVRSEPVRVYLLRHSRQMLLHGTVYVPGRIRPDVGKTASRAVRIRDSQMLVMAIVRACWLARSRS